MNRILLISHSSNRTGGGEDDFQRLLEYFNKRGYYVYTIFPEGYRAEYFKSLSYKYQIVPDNIFPFTGFNLRKYIMFLHITIKKIMILLPFLYLIKNKIDICFVNSSVCLSEIIALKIVGMNYVLSIKELINPLVICKLLMNFYNYSSLNVIVISKFLLNKINKYYNNNKIILIRSSIDESAAEKVKKSFIPYKDKDFTILNLGVITPMKNQMLLLKALANIKSNNKITVNFVGRIEDKVYFQKLKDFSLSITKRNICINFLGEVERNDAYRFEIESNLIVSTSRFEGMSLVLAESLYFEKPLITTLTGAGEEVIIDNQNGFHIDFDDYFRLADIIDALLNDPDIIKNIISNHIPTYKKYFSSDYYLLQHERILFGHD